MGSLLSLLGYALSLKLLTRSRALVELCVHIDARVLSTLGFRGVPCHESCLYWLKLHHEIIKTQIMCGSILPAPPFSEVGKS